MAKKILVIDDDLTNVKVVQMRLEASGFQVVIAADGDEGLLKAKMEKPDLIVLDIQMPRMNGYTFMMEKDKYPEYVSIPVIVLTAYGEMEPVFKRHGIKAYLLKPLKLQELLDKVQETIGV